MSKHFYTNLDLRFNQFLKSILEHLDSSTISAGDPGRIFWCTVENAPAYWDGTEVKYFAYKGEPINANDVVEDTDHQFVTEQDIVNWDQIVSDSANYELNTNKNQQNGYAGLNQDGKLAFSTLWDGMVIEYPVDSNEYKTLGELFNIANGIPTLDDDAELDPHIIKQMGYATNEQVLFVSQDEKDGWNAVSGGLSGVEVTAHKNQIDGYAGLNSTGRVSKRYLAEGAVIRVQKKVKFSFYGTILEGEAIGVNYREEFTQNFTAPANPDLENMLIDITSYLNGKADITASNTATSITVTAVTAGDDFNIQMLYLDQLGGTLSIVKENIADAFYDWSNMAGTNNIGYAPLNSYGVIEDSYLPSYRDIRVVDTYADMLALTDKYNGLRVHVIDATADPTVDSGWAEYLWLADINDWQKTTELESSVDISHDSMSNVQGDGALLTPPQTNHLTDAQYAQLKDSEYKITVNHLDARPGVLMKSFPKSTFRAGKIVCTIEDHAGRGILMEEISILFDGNYPTLLEFGVLSSPMNNPFTFNATHDINNVYLFMQSNSLDSSIVMRIKEFAKLDDIVPPLSPEIDLSPSIGLIPHN